MSGYWRATVDLILDRLLADDRLLDATDEEIVGYLVDLAPSHVKFPAFERRKLVEEVAARRTSVSMTPYACEMIPKIAEAYRLIARSDKRRTPSMSATATRAGCSRDTIADWIARGWMTWPPA